MAEDNAESGDWIDELMRQVGTEHRDDRQAALRSLWWDNLTRLIRILNENKTPLELAHPLDALQFFQTCLGVQLSDLEAAVERLQVTLDKEGGQPPNR